MKRALAERAKADAPAKIRKATEQTSGNDDTFYLRHQNRALATELKSLQYKVQNLEKERDYRRAHVETATRAINQLQATWQTLERALGIECHHHQHDQQQQQTIPTKEIPAYPTSTGTTTTEWTRSLLLAVAKLATPTVTETAPHATDQLANISQALAQRMNALQNAILQQQQQIMPDHNDTQPLTTQLFALQNQMDTLQTQYDEVCRTRDEYATRERKIRRNVYRAHAQILSIEQVVKAIDNDEIDAEIQTQVKQEAVQSNAEKRQVKQESQPVEQEISSVSTAKVENLQHHLEDVRAQIKNRDDTIERLNRKCSQLERQTNELTAQIPTPQDVRQWQSLVAESAQLKTSQQELQRLHKQCQRLQQEYANAKGDADALQNAMLDLTQQYETQRQDNGDHYDSSTSRIELEHKLAQALENVRQAEVVRDHLKQALALNEKLQARVVNLQEENSELQRQIEEHSSSLPQPQKEDISIAEKAGVTFAELTEKQFDRLYLDNRKMKKDLATLTEAKSSLKAKIERLEKERLQMNDSHARLLQQHAEKDEMNSKSLSTVLHLKSQTEQLRHEKKILEDQAKSASELAEAAHAVASAKEAVTREMQEVEESLRARIEEVLQELAELQAKYLDAQNKQDQESGKLATLKSELDNIKQRCDALVGQLEEKQKEINDLVEKISETESKWNRAQDQLSTLQDSESSIESVVIKNLNTHISQLKSRLACPVCHYREKECIIMRCRHMHCKQCVNERIQTRSRQCPTCNQKFSENDVEDVFLE